MDTKKSDFTQALANFWNTWDNYDNKVILKLIVCGSSASWMFKKLIGDKGGLYGRLTNSIYLKPFTLKECELYFNVLKRFNYSRQEILDIYMSVGGIPFYLNMFDNKIPVSKNIDLLFFKSDGVLRREYLFLFNSLFSTSNEYKRVLEALGSKLSGMTRNEIIECTQIEGGELSLILDNLINCDFIRSYNNLYNKKKGMIYQLIDLYSLFYIRFLNGENIDDENYWTERLLSGKKKAWSGYAFEQVCLHHVNQIKKSLGISGISTNVYSWFAPKSDTCSGAQIDLLIERSDNVFNICEIKYYNSLFIIDKDYYEHIKYRADLFKKLSKTNKAIKNTFITVYGLSDGVYNRVVDNQLILDDLFV